MLPDMRKGAVMQKQFTEILMQCGNLTLAAQNVSLNVTLLWNFYSITQYVH